MSQVLEVALVGAGFGGRMHIQALQRNSRARIAAIFDIDRSRSEALAAEFGVEQVPQSWSEVLDSRVDCVAIVVPPPLHERMSIEALSAGKHVVCEKPLAVDAQACSRIIAAAEHAGRRLFPVHNRVYMHSIETIGRIIQDGLIGQPYLVESHGIEGSDLLNQIPWLRTDPLAGVLRSQAIHPAYVLRWLFGEVAQVNAVIADRHVQGVSSDETALVTLRFTSGLLAHMTATFGLGRGPSDHTFTVYGSQGYLHTTWRDRESDDTERVLAVLKSSAGNDPEELSLPDGLGQVASLRSMWEDYAKAIATGRSARVVVEDAHATIGLIEAAYLSANANGAPVVPELPSSSATSQY